MSEEKIKELMYSLAQLKYTSKSQNHSYSFNVIGEDNLPSVEVVIRQHLLNDYNQELGDLKAKVYAYEKIIANSNFAPMLKESKDGEKNVKK